MFVDLVKEVGGNVEEGKVLYELGCSYELLNEFDEVLNCYWFSLK